MLNHIYGDILKRTVLGCAQICSSRRVHESHYDVLNVPRDCSGRQIREAFIKLSKKHHPDVSDSQESHSRFQEINRAYEVLGKTESRRDYDLSLICDSAAAYGQPEAGSQRHYHTVHDQHPRDPWKDPYFYVNRDKTGGGFDPNKPYYGVEGVNKIPNGMVAAICIMIATVGLGLQFLAANHSFTFRREELVLTSKRAQDAHSSAVETASTNGNQIQLELLTHRLLGVDDADDK